ncbi:MAG: aminotransferase class V-fold PLP-dependent enzyme [Microscillaceae bacterium]|jgi:selenocysteine lyase/cysteine desulfurase|nr:aminotransferase class V-fold PLP-dependent enzyme [Microscillaceae bacterium]
MFTAQKNLFNLNPKVTYLNCAYMSPLLKSVEQAGILGLQRKREPYEVFPGDFFRQPNEVRQEFAQLINAPESRVAIISSVSYGMAIVAKNLLLGKGQNIIVAAEQFPSNVYPWLSLAQETDAEVRIISPPDSLEHRGKIWNEKLLTAIDKNTRLVALGNVHWADGTWFDLPQIRIRTREVGALLAIDGTQSVGALPFDVQKIQPDALICAGYKWLMGPYGIGLAYFGEFFDNGKPLEENWINRLGSENFKELVNYVAEYEPGALRYEVGERSNFINIPMMLTALQQINAWKPQNIQSYCRYLTQESLQILQNRGFWVEDEAYRGAHLFGIRLPSHLSIEKVQAKFQAQQIYVSFRGNAIRIAPHIYNDSQDMAKLVESLLSM